MKRVCVLVAAALAGVSLFGDSACTGPFPSNPSSERLEVTVTAGPTSSASARLPLSFTAPDAYTVTIRALLADGVTVDTTFNGYVRLSSEPGSVQAVSGLNTNGRNAQLHNGVATGVVVSVLAAYGNTYIEAEDVGYVPADPARVCTTAAACPARCTVGKPCPPACANGIDDNDNGLIDGADPGCYLANDDTEDGGTYSAGVSQPLYYYVPRVADVRGGPEGGTGTPFPSQAVDIDTGYRGANQYAFSVVVTRVSSGGFYVTDLNEDGPGGGGFGSVYAYNFDAPPNMRQCDRLRSFGGTISDFYGFTEVNYPTWELEEWDPTMRPCLVPEPHLLAPTCTLQTGTIPNCIPLPPAGSNTTQMLSVAASLVRLESTPGAPAPASYTYVANPAAGQPSAQPSAPAAPAKSVGGGTVFHVGSLLGKAHPAAPGYAPTPDATNCDLDNSGKLDRTNANELACANACAANLECSEYSNFASQNQFNLVAQAVTWKAGDTSPTVVSTTDIQADASTDPTFSPVLSRGLSLGAFTGTLDFFSGGAQYTIQARCQDDVVPLGQPPVPSDTACVHARTIIDNSGSN